MTDVVLVDRPRPDIALVTLNRPERMNAMAFDVMVPLRKVLQNLTDAVEADRIGPVSRTVADEELLSTCFEVAERIASFSRPGPKLTKRTLWSGLDAASLEGHMQAEGLGQLFVRLLTANFEEVVAARVQTRVPVFADDTR